MKILSFFDLLAFAGPPIHEARDFSLYDGAPYSCACGSTHTFHQHGKHQLYGSHGVNARFMMQCPDNGSVVTMIETKNKFFIFFDRFVSLAGCTES